ncbi:ras guanine nucleotide exchange factor domain-containing protein [Umbelopsis sp. PMI_123]|nr:ras guanine nucleotide exchange factor domain-containing protein [Umbelopsis sp. PMI_123]
MTIDDIIDRLTQVNGPPSDDKFVLVFMTFFRRFMKPRELADMLTERIHTFFCQWLSTYWGDFCNTQTRKLMMLHLDQLSQHADLRPMCDELAPLIIREPLSEDPDTRWGLHDTEDCLGKKDSGYIGSFDSEQFLDLHSPILQPMVMDIDHGKPGNNDDGNRKHRPDPSPKSISNGAHVQKPRTAAHIHGIPPPRYQEPFKPKQDVIYEKNKWQPEFAGGLVNIDTHTRHGPNSSAASIMSTIAGGPTRQEKDTAQTYFKTFTGFSDDALADQLTWIEAELFYRIKPRQLIRNVWSTKARRQYATSISSLDQIKSPASKASFTPTFNPQHTSCPVLASIAHFNFISAWVSTIIVMQPKLSRRGKMLEKLMHVAVALRNRNNYNTLMAVLAGINSAAVLRLRHTRDWVSVKKIYKQFQSLERLMSTDRSFGSYRLALKASEAPGIPYLGIHNQDLLSLAEANKDFKTDGTIHWEKFRLMGDTILAMIRFQEPKFNIQPDAKILGFIAETELMNEDEQFQQSTAIEPRLKAAASSNRLRDLWFRV